MNIYRFDLYKNLLWILYNKRARVRTLKIPRFVVRSYRFLNDILKIYIFGLDKFLLNINDTWVRIHRKPTPSIVVSSSIRWKQVTFQPIDKTNLLYSSLIYLNLNFIINELSQPHECKFQTSGNDKMAFTYLIFVSGLVHTHTHTPHTHTHEILYRKNYHFYIQGVLEIFSHCRRRRSVVILVKVTEFKCTND